MRSLSYSHTMEILEIAQVEMYCAGEVVVEGPRRPDVLCVFWEGACIERESDSWENDFSNHDDFPHLRSGPTIWYAGDWTGPVSLQPDVVRSAAVPAGEKPKDIVAISAEGVKVSLDFSAR